MPNCLEFVLISFFLSIVMLLKTEAAADTIPGIPTVGESPYYLLCWAAAIKSCVTYYDPSIAQKSVKQVASVYTSKDDDAPPDTLAWVIRKTGEKVNLQSTWVQGKMTWPELKEEIDNNHPIVMLIRWGPTSNSYYHCNVIVGYINDSTKLYFMDPGGSGYRKYRSFSQILSNNIDNKDGRWECSYTTGLPTPISNGTAEQSAGPFKILGATNARNGRGITLLFEGNAQNRTVLQFFNAFGKSVYETEKADFSNGSAVTIPCSFSPGMYYLLYGRKNDRRFDVTGNSSFCVLK